MKIKTYTYRRLPTKLSDVLYKHFTLSGPSMFKWAIENDCIVQAFVVRNMSNKLLGWSAVYKQHGLLEIGVFVGIEYRHTGIGSRLRNKAVNYCVNQGLSYFWYDSRKNWEPIFVEVKNGI